MITGNAAYRSTGTAPYRVISQLASYDSGQVTRRTRLVPMHAGVTVEQALAASGFELLVAGDIVETAPPTMEQQRFMHEPDPEGLILGC